MKPGYFFTILALMVLLFTQCKKPVLNNLNPTLVVPRQIIAVNGTELGLAAVLWDAGTATEKSVDKSFVESNYFQVPQDATPGTHTVRLSNWGGNSANTVNVNVSALSGTWPAPRIEDITYRFLSINAADNTMSLVLYIAIANVDAKAEVSINNVVHDSFLFSAIPSDYFPSHPANTYGYPVYHYGQLITGINEKMGDFIDIKVKNIDGQTAATRFGVPINVASLDSDNDGLLDTWETGGYPVSGKPPIAIDKMGCNPYHKDVLVEVDWMKPNPADPFHRSIQPLDIWKDVEKVFNNAPVLNPDGSQGISIHVDRGQDVGVPGGVFIGGGSLLDFHFAIDFPATNSTYPDYASFYDYKMNAAIFDPDRRNIFHYCVFGYWTPGGLSGNAEIWGNDFMVNVAGSADPNATTVIGQTGTFIHELGHNLGLRHGGIDNNAIDQNKTYKPNQRSSMNYRYQFPGVSNDADFIPDGIQTYSMGMLKSIDETKVVEKIGICDNVPLDIDGDGVITSTKRAENVNSSEQDSDKTDILYDYDEWGFLKLIFTSPYWTNN